MGISLNGREHVALVPIPLVRVFDVPGMVPDWFWATISRPFAHARVFPFRMGRKSQSRDDAESADISDVEIARGKEVSLSRVFPSFPWPIRKACQPPCSLGTLGPADQERSDRGFGYKSAFERVPRRQEDEIQLRQSMPVDADGSGPIIHWT